VRTVLSSIPPAYLRDNPTDNNPDLTWACRVQLTIKAVRAGTLALEPAATLNLWNSANSIEQEAVPFPGGKAELQLRPGRYFLSAVGGSQRWPVEVQEPGTTITVLVSASGKLQGTLPQPVTEPDTASMPSMSPLRWIGVAFTAALVVFLMATFFVTRREALISQAAYNSLHFLTALCAGFAGGFIAGEALFRWDQQLAEGARFFISGTAGFALLFLVWIKYPKYPAPAKPPALS
jgi:hypothetical protein